MFWKKNRKIKVEDFNCIYRLSPFFDDNSVIKQTLSQKIEIKDKQIKIYNKKKWVIFKIPFKIKTTEDFLFRIKSSKHNRVKVAIILWDFEGREIWSDIRDFNTYEDSVFFKKNNMNKPDFLHYKDDFSENICHIGIYLYCRENITIFENLILEVGIDETNVLKEIIIEKYSNLLKNSTFSSADKIFSIYNGESSHNIKTNNNIFSKDIDITFPKFLNAENLSGINIYGNFPVGTISGIITEHGEKLENTACYINKTTILWNNIVGFNSKDRIKGIFFRKSNSDEILLENILFFVNKKQLSDIMYNENHKNRLLTGNVSVFSEGKGFWKDQAGISVKKSNGLCIDIEPFRAKERNFFTLSWNLYNNSLVLKEDIEGIIIGFSSKGSFSLRMLLTDEKSNEYWTLPFRINENTSGIVNYLWADFFQPSWIEKKIPGKNIISISFLFETDEKVQFTINSDFFQFKENGKKIKNSHSKCLYPVSEYYFSDIDNIIIKNSEGTECSFDSDRKVKLLYRPDSSKKEQYSHINFEKCINSSLSIPDLSGISFSVDGFNTRNIHRIVFKDENSNEYWSNPLDINNNKTHYFTYLENFAHAEWKSQKKDSGKYITDIFYNISGDEDEDIVFRNIQFFTEDADYYDSFSNDRNIYPLIDNSIYSNKAEIISNDNIKVLKKDFKNNTFEFDYIENNDNFLIFRYDMAKLNLTDFSGLNKINFNINTNFSACIKLLLSDLKGNCIYSDILDIHSDRNIYHEFRIEDFKDWENLKFAPYMLKNIEIHINNIKTQKNKLAFVLTPPVLSGRKIERGNYYYSGDFNFFSLKELSGFWTGAGEHSLLKLFNGWKDNSLDYPCLRGEFEIKTEDHEKNWIVLRKNEMENPLDLSDFDFITFYFKTDTKGIFLRTKWNDTKNNSYICTFNNISDYKDFIKTNISVARMSENIDISNIISYEFYIGLNWAKPVIKGNFFFASYSDKKIIIESEKKQNIYNTKRFDIENFEKKIEASKTKIRIGNELFSFEEIQKLAQNKLKFGIVDFSRKDIIMEESRKNRKWGLGQAAVFVEPTNLCNLACIMCNHGDNSFERSLGVMKFKDFKKLADEIAAKKFNIWEVSPFWMGEPFIHPQITEFISYLSSVRRLPGTVQHFNIHTNGNVLTKEHIDCIVESELDSILFSIDAAKEETYRKIRVNGELSIVCENIKKLLEARNLKGKKQPAIILQFILMDENSGEVPDFIEMGKNLGINKVIFAGRKEDNKWNLPQDDNLLFPQIDFDLVFIKALEPNALTKEQSHREIITKIPEGMKRRPCGSLWRMFSIAWDGEATACCRDDQVKMPVGNVLENGIENVWYGEKLKEIRLAHIKGEFEKAPKCSDCVNWVKYPMKDSEIIEWLESVGEDILADKFKKKEI